MATWYTEQKRGDRIDRAIWHGDRPADRTSEGGKRIWNFGPVEVKDYTPGERIDDVAQRLGRIPPKLTRPDLDPVEMLRFPVVGWDEPFTLDLSHLKPCAVVTPQRNLNPQVKTFGPSGNMMEDHGDGILRDGRGVPIPGVRLTLSTFTIRK